MKVVIFCGGYGTRMWPISRKSNPKQFAPLINGKSFFELTISRFKKEFDPSDIFVSTEKNYIHFIHSQAPEIPKENIIAEPERKDNLGAIGLATAIINKRFPSEVMLVSWSDHFIAKENEFLEAMKTAGEYAKKTGVIVSVNEEPTYPSISNEWVKLGKPLETSGKYTIFKIAETVKRPELAVAKKFFESKEYLINTGYRAWRTDTMLSYYKEFAPEIYEGLTKIADSYNTSSSEETLKTEYAKFPKNSVEFGIFVKLSDDKSATIPVNFGWSDAGTWGFFFKASKKDKDNNVVEGSLSKNIDAHGNLIIGDKKKVISIIGLENIAVIDTPTGLVVSKLERSDEVKEIFQDLETNHPEFVD